ncbi:DUF4153 domain-containing protein [Intestinirhabdus alba]|jgi:hypothetical protein|uniref:DUF4153 domain-containing protein n=1 Tax=Intestinirhabdus alba TaxID=2899544 RepID=A0A6L6IQE3_9ENTR|nr:DUF4153 domain-containing protein [Intestinirhabdus alba]MTH47716.1 DUF4153 domain-containing protein [Intestinirhabdus alba]
MESVELSRAARYGMVVTGLLQGMVCYLISAWLVPQSSGWMFYGIPAIMVCSAMLLLTVTSFRQRALWGWMALIAAVVSATGFWLRQHIEVWEQTDIYVLYSFHLLFIAMLALPWIQYHLWPSAGASRYAHFYTNAWRNALTLLLVLTLYGLLLLALLLWSQMFEQIGISFFHTLFFDTEGMVYIMLGLISALGAILARTHGRLVAAMQKLLTLMATGLLPLFALLALVFIATLPFTGLATLSRRFSAAGLLLTLALTLLILMTAVREPQSKTSPWPRALRYPIHASLPIAPVYVLLAGWALWQRIEQYGWTPQRLYGVLVTLVALVWSLGYLLSVLLRRYNAQRLQGKVVLGVSLLALGIQLLLLSPVLDVWRISVNSHMALYRSGSIDADEVSLYMLQQSGRPGHEALEQLRKDERYIADPERKRVLERILRDQQSAIKALSAEGLVKRVVLAPGSRAPEPAFWSALIKTTYDISPCVEQDACVVVEQDLNDDGKSELMLYVFGDANILIYHFIDNGWKVKGVGSLPPSLSKDKLLQAAAARQLNSAPKVWRDTVINGERLELIYY